MYVHKDMSGLAPSIACARVSLEASTQFSGIRWIKAA